MSNYNGAFLFWVLLYFQQRRGSSKLFSQALIRKRNWSECAMWFLGAINTNMQERNMGTHTLVNAALDPFQILLWMVRTPNHPVGPTHSTLPDGPIKSESSPPLMSTQRLLCYSLQISPALPFTRARPPQMDLKCIQYRILLTFSSLEAMKETYLYSIVLHWMLLRKYSPSFSLSMGGYPPPVLISGWSEDFALKPKG